MVQVSEVERWRETEGNLEVESITIGKVTGPEFRS